jgi:hypothetical protein
MLRSKRIQLATNTQTRKKQSFSLSAFEPWWLKSFFAKKSSLCLALIKNT